MTAPPPLLPDAVRVIVRGWLSANHVLLHDADASTLVDSGYATQSATTLARLRGALQGRRLRALVNTHCHSDHMGGNAAVARAFGCPVRIPSGEAPLVEAWDTRALWLDFADQQAERFEFGGTIAPGDTLAMGGLKWQAIAAPGHDMGALVFHCPEAKLLISGDALWENGFGIVLPDADAYRATRATLESLARLDVRVVIPGHGQPFTAVAPALERAFSRLEALEADPVRGVKHILKVMLTFKMLEQRRMPLRDLPAYLERVACYREFNESHLRLPYDALAELLAGDLQRAGVLGRDGDQLVAIGEPG